MHANGCPKEFEGFEFKKSEDLSFTCKTIVDRFDVLTRDINVYDVNGKCYKPDGDSHKLMEENKYETAVHHGIEKKYKRYAT